MTIKTYFTPHSPAEALTLKAEHGRELWVMAGGTIFMHLINDGYLFPEQVMGLRRAEMDGIQMNGSTVIGAAATMSQMTQLSAYPLLQEAAQAVAGWAVRNMGTVGGNLFARAPYGDFAVALLALDASLQIECSSGKRTVPLAEFFAGGRQLAAAELVTAVHVPGQGSHTYFHKYSPRQANAPTIVTVALNLVLHEGSVQSAAIALGGAAATPVRAAAAEAILTGSALTTETIAAAAATAAAACHPVTDAVASEWYRRRMIEVQLRRALLTLAEGGN